MKLDSFPIKLGRAKYVKKYPRKVVISSATKDLQEQDVLSDTGIPQIVYVPLPHSLPLS